jgi:peptidoglycan hydrolase-like protein with peptidoglycan-binding domain
MGESAGKVIDTTGKFADRLREAPKIEVQQFALNPEDCFFQSHEQLLALADGADDALGQLSVSVAQDRNHLFRIEDPFLGFTDARGNRSRMYYSSRINSRKDLVDAITAMKGHRQVWQTQQALIALGYFDFAPRQSSEKSSKPRPAALGPQSHGEQLNALAAENGLPNGFLDRPTAAAVRLLQKESGLPETGVLDTPTLIAIAQRYPVKKSKRDTFEYDDALAGSPAAKFTVELDFRGCVALRGLGRYSDACRSPNETELVAQFDEVAAIIRGLRGNDASRATVETKLRPVFDVTVTNGSSKPDLLTHIELGFLRAEGEAGDAGAPTVSASRRRVAKTE